MRLTVPHYYDFGAERERVGRDLADPAAWDTLRDGEGPFGLPSTRADWVAIASDPATVARAVDIGRVARGRVVRRLCSYGEPVLRVPSAFLYLLAKPGEAA